MGGGGGERYDFADFVVPVDNDIVADVAVAATATATAIAAAPSLQ